MEMISIAKRENNNKRKYLVVNRLQGKHIPVSGITAFDTFDALAENIADSYSSEKLLVVGFAETATAIGARLAVKLNCGYIQTTREKIDNVEYLYFTESHSHATEQKLVKDDIDLAVETFDRIVFAEDEVTTGNTILKIVNIIKELYPGKVKFSIASLINGMDDSALERYPEDIDIHYLLRTNYDGYTEIAEEYKGNGEYAEKNIAETNAEIKNITAGYMNTRRLVSGEEYDKACGILFNAVESDIDTDSIRTMAVIGTEEFMYPALYTAACFERKNIEAVTHSTTRSPIAVSLEAEYPVRKRFELVSFYDDDRRTFIYDLKKYDCVIIITDSKYTGTKGADTLVNALKSAGNDNIRIYRWCDNDKE